METPGRAAATPPLVTAAFGMLVCAHFLQGLGQSSLLLLPLYLDMLGASRGLVGVLMILANFGGLITRPFVGVALDRFGRKLVIAVGTALFAAGMVLVLAVGDLGWEIWVARVLMGVGIGVIFTGYITLAADVIPESRRTEGIALFGVSGLLPMAFPPLITASGITPGDLRYFYPAVSVLIVGSLLFLRAIPEAPRTQHAPLPAREVLTAMRSAALRPVWFATLTFGTLAYVFGSFATVVAEHRHIPDPALMWLTYAIGAVAVRVFGGRLPERVGPSRVLGPAIASYIMAVAVAAFATDVSGFLVAGLFAGVGHGYSFPIMAGQVATRSPIALRGSAMAAFTALWDVAAIVFVPLAGALADATTDRTMLVVVALAAFVALLAWSRVERGVAGSLPG